MAGKQLSRLTSQDRVLTANDLFDPNERPHGAVMALKETKNLVDHSTQAHIFATKAELDAFVNEQKALALSERKVKVGDNLYISDTGVPDYWWTGVEGQWISELEVGRVDVTVDTSLDGTSANPIANSAVTAKFGAVEVAVAGLEESKMDTQKVAETGDNTGVDASDENQTANLPDYDNITWGIGTMASYGCKGASIKPKKITTFRRSGSTANGQGHLWFRILRYKDGAWYVAYRADQYVVHDSYTRNGQPITHTLEHVAGPVAIPTDERVVFCYANAKDGEATNIHNFGAKVVNVSPDAGVTTHASGLPASPSATGSATYELAVAVEYDKYMTLEEILASAGGGDSGGGFDPTTLTDIAIGAGSGTNNVCYGGSEGVAIGHDARFSGSRDDTTGGVSIGRRAESTEGAVAIGGSVCSNSPGAQAGCYSVAIGACANTWISSAAVGYAASALNHAVAIGNSAYADVGGVSIGKSAGRSAGENSVIIGTHAGNYHTCGYQPSVVIGPYAEGGIDANGNTGHYPIVIGTSCSAVGGNALANATIRVDANGNLTVGGKPVGGGGDSAVEVWKGNVGFGEQDTFIGAKKTADGDGQFQKGYPRLHNHGQDIHEVSGFSRDSYDNEDVWSHRFVIPWDLAMANDMSYMAANVKWQGSRNLLQPGDETTFVQPLMPANTGNTSSVFPYAIPAFEESPVYWSGTIIYNDTQEACGTYTETAKTVSVPWEAMCSAETAYGGYDFLLYRKSTQPSCQKADGVAVTVMRRESGGGEIVLASQDYVKTLEQRIQALETKLAAVGA